VLDASSAKLSAGVVDEGGGKGRRNDDVDAAAILAFRAGFFSVNILRVRKGSVLRSILIGITRGISEER